MRVLNRGSDRGQRAGCRGRVQTQGFTEPGKPEGAGGECKSEAQMMLPPFPTSSIGWMKEVFTEGWGRNILSCERRNSLSLFYFPSLI